jgi:hypothetical protein
MRKLLFAVAAVAVMAVPTVSNAQLQLGARLGYGFTAGEVEADADASDFIKAMIPIQVDLNYKLNKNLALGVYFSYAFGTVGDLAQDFCDAIPDSDCSASGMRFGIQALYDFSPGASFNPWVGLGTGWESATFSIVGEDITYSGWEWATLQAGADWTLSKGFGLGPFLSWGFGQYSSYEDPDGSVDVTDKGTHQLIQIGVRGLFSF